MHCLEGLKRKGGTHYETRKNVKHQKATEHCKERWLWRMPNLLPVSMQDILYCRQPDLRKQVGLDNTFKGGNEVYSSLLKFDKFIEII